MDTQHELLGKIHKTRQLVRDLNFQITLLEQRRSDAARELGSYYEDLCQVQPLVLVEPEPAA